MTIRTFLQAQKGISRHWLNITVGLGLFAGLLLIAQAWFLALIINGIIFEQKTLSDVQIFLWLLLLLFCLRAFLVWAVEKFAFRAAADIKLHLRSRLHRHLLSLGPVLSSHEHSGAQVNILVDGIEALENYYAHYLPAMSLVVLVPIALLVFIFPLDWISGLVALATAPVIPFFMIMIGRGAEKLNKKQWRKLARMSAHFLDMIQGLTSLKMFNAARREATMVAAIADDYRKSTMSVLRVAFLSSLLLELFASIGIAIVAVVIGFRLLYMDIDFLHGFFILILIPDFYLPLRNLGTHYHARMDAIGAAEQMLAILEKSVPEYQSTVTQSSKTSPAFSDIINSDVAITFDSVSFSYEEGRQALDTFSLNIQAGERVALIGASGAGKSTVVNLLLGFIQSQQGSIMINGQDLRGIPIALWREQIAWLPQRPYLFFGTIADNIRMGNHNATDDEIKEAAQLAHCDVFINQLVDGYETHIGEHGKGLSGGQVQRVALARAFLKNAPLLILDEAAAHLDKHSEQLIQESIDLLSENRTVIVVAHRLHTIENVDQIVVIDKGKAGATGTHQKLLAESIIYQEMIHEYQKLHVLRPD